MDATPGGVPATPSDNRPEESNAFWLDLDRKVRIQSRPTHPICLTRGDGVKLWDVTGREFCDFEAGQICASVGHTHRDYIAALKDQLDRLVQTGSCYIADTQVRFQAKLAETSGGRYGMSYLVCSGSESNEAALRFAKAYTGRQEVISFHGNYHGNTLGSWSATGFGGPARERYGLPAPGVTFLPTPYTYPVPNAPRFPQHDEAVIEACIRFCEMALDATTTGKPAAIMVELIQSPAGVREMPISFLRAIRRICDERGALMVVDEAQTGIGRLGAWWGYELYGVLPDVIAASKTLGGGVPLGAILVSREMAEEAVRRGFRMSSSHTGDPLLAAAGLATLEIIEREGLLENVRDLGGYLKQALQALFEACPQGGEVRGRGFLLGLEFVNDKETGAPNVEATQLFTDACRERGLLTGWWRTPSLASNIVRLMPPYTLRKAEADHALAIVAEALEVVTKSGVISPQTP